MIGGLILLPAAWRDALLDEAFVTFRYASHLSAGQGLVYNPGEAIEGFDSLLWTMLIALGIHLGLEASWIPQLLGIVCNVLLALTTFLFARRHLQHSPFVALIAPMMLVANLNVGAWVAHGLATPLLSLLMMLGLVASSKSPSQRPSPQLRALLAGSALALAVATAVEGLLFMALVVVFRTVHAVRRRHISRDDLAFLLSGPVPICLLVGWRLHHYGRWLPAPFYARADAIGDVGRGAAYLMRFFNESLAFGIVLLPMAGMALRLHRGSRPLLLASIVTPLAYAVALGGDTHSGAHLLVPILAPLYLLIQDGLNSVLSGPRPLRVFGAASVLLLGLSTLVTSGPSLVQQAEASSRQARNHRFVGTLLRELTSPDAILATRSAGALPFYAQRNTIDLDGVNDVLLLPLAAPALPALEADRQTGRADAVLARRPHLILLRDVWLANVPIEAHRALYGRTEQELAAHPEFLTQYEPVNLRLRPDLLFGFYLRRDLPRSALEERFRALDLHALGSLEALTSDPPPELALYQSGQAREAAGDLAEADRYYASALALYPEDGEAHLARGRVLAQLGRLKEALEQITTATRLLAARGEPWELLGALEVQLQHPGAAIQAYERALAIDPSHQQVYEALSSLLLTEQKYAEALPVIRSGLARAPASPVLWRNLGYAAGNLQRWSDAREALTRLSRLEPDSPGTQELQRFLAARLPS